MFANYLKEIIPRLGKTGIDTILNDNACPKCSKSVIKRYFQLNCYIKNHNTIDLKEYIEYLYQKKGIKTQKEFAEKIGMKNPNYSALWNISDHDNLKPYLSIKILKKVISTVGANSAEAFFIAYLNNSAEPPVNDEALINQKREDKIFAEYLFELDKVKTIGLYVSPEEQCEKIFNTHRKKVNKIIRIKGIELDDEHFGSILNPSLSHNTFTKEKKSGFANNRFHILQVCFILRMNLHTALLYMAQNGHGIWIDADVLNQGINCKYDNCVIVALKENNYDPGAFNSHFKQNGGLFSQTFVKEYEENWRICFNDKL